MLKLAESGGIPHDTVDKISISGKRAHEVSENAYAFQFDYCAAVYNEGGLGVIVSSDTERIPVPIDPNIQISQCQQYGTQIRAFSISSIDVSLFYEKDLWIFFLFLGLFHKVQRRSVQVSRPQFCSQFY